MTPSSFAPNLADSDGASEDTFSFQRPPTPDPRPPTPDSRPPSSVLRLLSSGLPPSRPSRELSDHRPPSSVLRLPTSRFPPAASPSPISDRVSGRLAPACRGYGDLPSSRKCGHAFSLVELLVVVGIIAMLSVAAVPVMRGLGGSQSSRATAQILVSALEQARTAAILSGTNAYLVLPDAGFPATNYQLSSYAIIRPKVTNNGGPQDDFFTNQTADWIVLSKWERLPGNLVFSANKVSTLTNLAVTNLSVPKNPGWRGDLRAVGFTPGGGLTDTTGTNGLLFAPSNKVAAGKAAVADRIEISFYSGRVRYAGLTNDVEF